MKHSDDRKPESGVPHEGTVSSAESRAASPGGVSLPSHSYPLTFEGYVSDVFIDCGVRKVVLFLTGMAPIVIRHKHWHKGQRVVLTIGEIPF